ncbi:hypothetical protein BH23GEM4_BH23GEM4_16540 [soil metagenome]
MDPLDRLYWRLAGDLDPAPPDGAAPLSVAEIYQQRIPYRTARAELGFSELAQYEHAMLRLLSGERGYAELEIPAVQEEIVRELRSANPILGIYRDYAAVGVVLRMPAAGPMPSATAPPAAAPPPPPAPSAAPAPAAPFPTTRTAESPCPRCAGPLPRRRPATYCPHCGTAIRPVPCGECGAEVEPGWKFCVECGQPRSAPQS